MEFTSIILAILLVVLTYLFLFARTAKKQSVEVEVNGEKVIRSVGHTGGLVASIGSITTLHELFVEAVKKFPDQKCTGTRKKLGTKKDKDGKDVADFGEFEWTTYKELKIRSDNFGSGLRGLGTKPGDRVGIFSTNREDWLVTQQGCYAHSLAIVSFYETLGKETLKYVADHSEIKVAVCNIESLGKMFEIVSGKDAVKAIRHIIVMDKFGEDKIQKAKEYDVQLHYFRDIEASGAKTPVPYSEPTADDLSTIMYTSGTTGVPKGVLITHKNIVSEVAAIQKVVFIRSDEAYLSYLPLAHIFERVILTACLSFGAAIGFFRGDTRFVIDDMKELKPTLFVAVPRIFDRAKSTILSTVAKQPPAAQYAFKIGFQLKKFLILYLPWVPTTLIDKYIFAKPKQALGGKVELIISAGAPLTYETEAFMRVAFGCVVSQAYGLTESSGSASFKRKEDITIGHLGPPMPCNEFKLLDIPDMGYTRNDYPHPRGELLIRGNNIATGYYKDAEKSAETFSKDKWFSTGDIAEWTSEGVFRIIDRKKNMFKLAQGEYVAAEKVEGKLADGASVVEQVFVYGDSTKTTLIAVVVPKESELKSNVKTSGSFEQICASKEAREYVGKKLIEAGKAAGLHGFEIPVKVHLHHDPFTVENDLMTPTMKLKRNILQDKFKKEIATLYKEIGDR